ncbi:uncharacterized protein LOC129348303 [Amphiprion ocellaris]|uniref:uncharacterized protein LOC129348303 n=1 Tax=Amphiprion ocellaris TaxID=80972 RepID=UPI00241147BF|nr:uncharacterized protein LOC129348303 [Amphiprion ocellaris]
MTQILKGLKNEVKNGIVDEVKSNMEKEPLNSLVDFIILSHIEDKNQLDDLLEDKNKKSKLLSTFKTLSKAAAQTFYADLGWQNKVNSSLASVIDEARAEAKGKVRGILILIQTAHVAALAEDAISAMLSMSGKFFSNLQEELETFKKSKDSAEKVKVNELSASDVEMLEEFKQDVEEAISAQLADAFVEVFHQKFSSHVVSHVQNQVNGVIGNYVRTGLKSDSTDEKLLAGQNNSYISYMPVNTSAQQKGASKRSQFRAEKIKDPKTAGTILDIRVLAEANGTKVVILTEDSRGKLTKLQELSPSTKPTSQTVTLVYRPKSDQHPDGHYDVRINNETVKIDSKGESSLFPALARGMKPKASESEVRSEADRLRSVEADTLLKHPGQWDSFIKREEMTGSVSGQDWFSTAGAASKVKESKMAIQNEAGKVQMYKKWQKSAKQNPEVGKFIKADHQPPVKSMLEARKLTQESKLAKAMLDVGTKTSPLTASLTKHQELSSVYASRKTRFELPNTKLKAFATRIATAISKDDVVGAFKLTILGATKRFTENFSNSKKSLTRLNMFDSSFQQHCLNLVQQWFDLLKDKNVMMKNHLTEITAWIKNKGYKNRNDPLRKQVSNLL